MSVEQEPDLNLFASLVNGANTVVFPAKPYQRLIRSVWVSAGIATGATIYRGIAAAPGLIDSVKFANPNTYNIPFVLPAGQILLVVFDAIGTGARARLSSSRQW